jgi:hypothetical protein
MPEDFIVRLLVFKIRGFEATTVHHPQFRRFHLLNVNDD